MSNKKRYVFKLIFICFCMLVLTACGSSGSINYNLTKMGNTFTQEMITKMQDTPRSYVGKTIRITGEYESAGLHYLKGADDTNCCYWQLEVRLADETMTFPNTKRMTVTGVYKQSTVAGSGTTYYLEITKFG